MIAPDRVAAVLLAAGQSRRFGAADKLLAPIGGKPMILHSAELLAGSGFNTVIAVVSSSEVGALLRPLGFSVMTNGRPDAGQSHSLALGIGCAGWTDAEAALVALADMPFVSARHLRSLLAAHDDLTATSLGGEPMPPAIFGRKWFGALAGLQGDRGAKALLADALFVEGDPAELADIDTPAGFTSRRPSPSS